MRLQHNIKGSSPSHHYAVDAYGCQGKEVCVQVKQLSETNPVVFQQLPPKVRLFKTQVMTCSTLLASNHLLRVANFLRVSPKLIAVESDTIFFFALT